MNIKLCAYLILAATLLMCGLSTGAQVYYLISFTLLILLALSVAAAIWALLTVKVEMKGLKGRVERGETLMTIFTVRHMSVLPVSAIRLRLSVPSAFSPNQEISVPAMPFVKKPFRWRIACPHRGVFEAGVTKIFVSDLFGLVTLSKNSGMRLVKVDVAPRVPGEVHMDLKGGDLGPETISRSDEDTASPSAVR